MFGPSPWLRMELSLHMPCPRQLSTAVHPLASAGIRNARLPGRRFHLSMTGRLAAGFRACPCICRSYSTRGSENLGIALKQHSRLAGVSLAVQFRVFSGHATVFRCYMSNAKQEEPSPGLGAKTLKSLEAKSLKSRTAKRPADVSSVDSQEGAVTAVRTSKKGVSSASTSTSKTSRSKANRKNLMNDTIVLGAAKTAANGSREGVSAASSDATHQISRVKKVKKVDQTYSSAKDHVSNGSSPKSTPSVRHSDSSLEQGDTSQKSVKKLSTRSQSSSVVNTGTSRIGDSQQPVSKSSVSYATLSQSEQKPVARKTNFPSALDSTTPEFEQNIVPVDTNVSKLQEVSLDGSNPNHVLKDCIAVQSSNSSMGQEGSRVTKRVKKKSEGIQITWKLNSCSKYADFHGAIEIYNKLKSEGKCSLLQQHAYNVLLYLCSGAASGTLTRGKSGNDEKNKETVRSFDESTAVCLKPSNNAKSGELKLETEGASLDADVVHFSPEDMKLAAWKGVEIYEDMMNARIPANEATLTSVVRLATAKGDGDLAFEIIKRMAGEGIEPKLRSYSPPLLLFCKTGQAKKAYEVDDHMLAAGVHPDEALLEALLKVSIDVGREDKVYSLLHRLRTTVREVSVSTVGTIERWFNSEVAASAEKEKDNLPSKEDLNKATEAGGGGWHGLGWLGRGKWKVTRTNITKQGRCMSCGERLCTIDIDPEEREVFAKSVAKLACQRELKSNGFLAFQRWLEKHGPFEAVIDGANVGLYSAQTQQGFNFYQLNSVVRAVSARTSNKRPLIVLHSRRTSNLEALTPKTRLMVERWMEEKTLYSTPIGSNDDWYWLYAAVSCKCLIVTNDEMRDHLFQLLGDDFFPKWKERHQVRFTFSANNLELHMPPPYSIVIQESESGSWHIPQKGGDDIETLREWLCVTRPEAAPIV